jgi:hypothetical protein
MKLWRAGVAPVRRRNSGGKGHLPHTLRAESAFVNTDIGFAVSFQRLPQFSRAALISDVFEHKFAFPGLPAARVILLGGRIFRALAGKNPVKIKT